MFNLKRHFWNALRPLLDRALDLDVVDRRQWLDELRLDCPTIARELELLLGPELEVPEGQRPTDRDVVPGSLEWLGLRG